MGIVWMIVVGFVVGLIARAVMPGTQNLGIILTAVLGIVGSVVAGFIGQAIGWYQAGQGAGFIGS
ncbi:MAG TPA: GlsB/YeaQ/YmgE family stress response membrane protein, partial [Burkholderiaceae bacterium]|nr:GlsB/YeaQ/YmgE family stress response membrane protein [Burkholderiaceae bacterium]